MALFHSRFQVISRSTGRSAPGAAAYRAACCLVDERTGEVFDYTRKRHVDLSRISLPPGAPDWMQDRSRLWNSAEAAERRKDAQVCREIEFSLPIELTPDEQAKLAEQCIQMLVDMGMVVDWNCHHLGGRNPHFHAMAAMRRAEPGGWAKTKERAWNDHGLANRLRASWADLTNHALATCTATKGTTKEYLPRVDHRSFKERGIARPPQQHIARALMGMAKRGIEWAVAFVNERRVPPPKANIRKGSNASEHQSTFWELVEFHGSGRVPRAAHPLVRHGPNFGHRVAHSAGRKRLL